MKVKGDFGGGWRAPTGSGQVTGNEQLAAFCNSREDAEARRGVGLGGRIRMKMKEFRIWDCGFRKPSLRSQRLCGETGV